MLMLLERMILYLEEHPNVVKHIAANCTLFDEEKIEFRNAKVACLYSCEHIGALLKLSIAPSDRQVVQSTNP
jgi:hypothetical protein